MAACCAEPQICCSAPAASCRDSTFPNPAYLPYMSYAAISGAPPRLALLRGRTAAGSRPHRLVATPTYDSCQHRAAGPSDPCPLHP